jgi:hypothetical protein
MNMKHWWNVVDREFVKEYSACIFRKSNYLFIFYLFIYILVTLILTKKNITDLRL